MFIDRTAPDSGDYVLDLIQSFKPTIEQQSVTSFKVTMSLLNVVGNPTSYIVKYQRLSDNFTPIGTEQTVTSPTNGIVITGLTGDSTYRIKAQLANSSGVGNILMVYYYLSATAIIPSKGSSDKTNGIPAKSFLQVIGPNEKNKYAFAYRDFESIQVGTLGNNYTIENLGTSQKPRNVRNYNTYGYYSFGTSIIFDPFLKYKRQEGGFGFFLDGKQETGYFILVKTTSTAASSNTTPIQIFKLAKGKQLVKLSDSQKGNRATLDELFAGTVYNIDVKVRIYGKTVTITAYVNGFKIEAVDTTSTTNTSDNEIIYPSKTVALVGSLGTSKFDYVYADTITADQYNQNYQLLNFYYGQFAADFLDSSYGDMLYRSNNTDVDMEEKKNAFDEFGTVVREITKKTIRFDSGAAFPVKWTTGGNQLAHILNQTYDNFKAQVLVLNNSSITIPLADGGINELGIMGNTIGFSGEIEYTTAAPTEYGATEPVIFESAWLQNGADVASLAEWIQSKVVNKSQIITMNIFGNPLISVGDIITIDYPYQEFTAAKKIIVVKVNHSYREGLETEIVGRTL